MWPFRTRSRHRVDPDSTQGVDLRRSGKRARDDAIDAALLRGLTRTPGTGPYGGGPSETEDALRRAVDAREGAALPADDAESRH